MATIADPVEVPIEVDTSGLERAEQLARSLVSQLQTAKRLIRELSEHLP